VTDPDPKDVVRRGYDAIVDRYNAWADSFATPERVWVEKLAARLEPGSSLLDLGCGGGRESAQTLATRYRYTGVDISEEQLRRARERIPTGRFVRADVTRVELDPESFEAVVSLFMFGHIPRAQQEPLLRRVAAWLRADGWLLTTLGTADAEGVEEDWLGAPMFFASFDEETNLGLLERAGFVVEEARVVPFEEPGHGLVRFMWVLARRKSQD
jgi:cyclopropane fatty-acyl-phospholipid synthase-like methyltransferase